MGNLLIFGNCKKTGLFDDDYDLDELLYCMVDKEKTERS